MNRREFSLAALSTLATPVFSLAQTVYPEPKVIRNICNKSNDEVIVDIDDKFLDTFASWKGKYLSADGVMNGERFKLYCTENRREIKVRLSNNFEFPMFETVEYLKMEKVRNTNMFPLVIMGTFYQNTIFFTSIEDRQLITNLVRKTFTGKELYTHGIAWHKDNVHLTISDIYQRSFEATFSSEYK